MAQNLKTGTRALWLLGLLALTIVLGSVVETAFAQTPAPTPQDKRGLGIDPTTSISNQTDQTKSREAKPELVPQTGYNSFSGPTRLVFSPDGHLLATATFPSSTIKLWETATGRELRDLSTGGQNSPGISQVVAFSGDSRLLAATAGSGSVKVWEVTTGREVQTLSGTQASSCAELFTAGTDGSMPEGDNRAS